MLRRILFKHQRPGQLLLAFTGALLGMFLFLFAFQMYSDINEILSRKSYLIGKDYIVMHKKVSALKNTLGGSKGYFSEKEIADIKAQPFVTKAAPFTVSTFHTWAVVNSNGAIPELKLEMFFEAIPDEFIDVELEDWHWEEGVDSIVPIIIPTEFLNLYNFGFAAQFQRLPQMSKGTISFFTLELHIGPRGQREVLKGRIVGYSDRINTLLTPLPFIEYGNKYFGVTDREPTRMIIETEDPASPELARYMEDNDYEVNQEKLKSSKVNAVLNLAVPIVGFIAIVIVILSLIVFTLSFQLLIANTRDEIKLLLDLGYKRWTIIRYFMGYFLLILIGVASFTLVGILVAKNWFVGYLDEREIEAPEGINVLVYVILPAFVLFFLLSNLVSVRQGIKKLS